MSFKVYLDTCVYCRPFDDQSQRRIARETEAFASILESSLVVVGSDVLDDEISQIEKAGICLDARGFTNICRKHVSLTDAVVREARRLIKQCGFKPMDALHLASAISNADYFITTDDEIIKKNGCVKDIKIMDPVAFVEEYLWK